MMQHTQQYNFNSQHGIRVHVQMIIDALTAGVQPFPLCHATNKNGQAAGSNPATKEGVLVLSAAA